MWPLHKVEECKLDKSAEETKACRQKRFGGREGTNRKNEEDEESVK